MLFGPSQLKTSEDDEELEDVDKGSVELKAGKAHTTSFYAKADSDQMTVLLLDAMPDTKTWVAKGILRFKPSDANLQYIVDNMHLTTTDPRVQKALQSLASRAEEREQRLHADARRLAEGLSNFPFKTTPYTHQAETFALSRDEPVWAMFLEMGCGKTKISLDSIAHLWLTRKVDVVLVIAPKGVHSQWILEETPTHLPDVVPRRLFELSLNRKLPEDALKPMRVDFDGVKRRDLRIAAINIDAVNAPRAMTFLKKLLDSGKSMIIVDESSRIKSPQAQRTKNCIELGRRCRYKRILTGTPSTQGLHDLYAQMLFLDPNVLGLSTFTAFKRRYCRMGGFDGKAIIGYRNVIELMRRVNSVATTIKKRDCLDLPPKVYTKRRVELSPEQQKLYQRLKKEFILQLEDGRVIDTSYAITRLLRLQQIICGHLRDPDTEELIELKSPRFDVCKDLVEQAEGKVIIWSRFIPDLLRLEKMFPGCVTYHGGVSTAQRKENIRRFREDDDCKLFIGQQRAGGLGLNLTVASTMIYFSNDFSAETRWQSEARIDRIGQTEKMTYIDLYAPETVDKLILHALDKKKSVADLIVDHKAMSDLI